MPIILRLIAMGVPAAKIIAKYGKKAYKAAKTRWDKAGKKKHLLLREKPLPHGTKWPYKESKWYKWKKSLSKKDLMGDDMQSKGGKIKTYAKGSTVRKPRSY